MEMFSTTQSIISALTPHLPSPSSSRPFVIMTCGIAGSGKSTLARALTISHPSFTQTSIDSIIYSRLEPRHPSHDQFEYDNINAEAVTQCFETLDRLLCDGKNVVVDNAFYCRATRDQYRSVVERHKAKWMFVVFRVEKEVLWERVEKRNHARLDRDDMEGLEVTREMFDAYWDGFEWPEEDGQEGNKVFEVRDEQEVRIIGLSGPQEEYPGSA